MPVTQLTLPNGNPQRQVAVPIMRRFQVVLGRLRVRQALRAVQPQLLARRPLPIRQPTIRVGLVGPVLGPIHMVLVAVAVQAVQPPMAGLEVHQPALVAVAVVVAVQPILVAAHLRQQAVLAVTVQAVLAALVVRLVRLELEAQAVVAVMVRLQRARPLLAVWVVQALISRQQQDVVVVAVAQAGILILPAVPQIALGATAALLAAAAVAAQIQEGEPAPTLLAAVRLALLLLFIQALRLVMSSRVVMKLSR